MLLLWGIWIAIGLAVGSFINVVVLRWPAKQNFINSRSRCPTCSHQLAWFDLVPIVSFLLLRGRCRYCNVRISPQYLVVEAISASLAVAVFYRFSDRPAELLFWFITVCILFTLLLFDLKYLLLPDKLVLSLVVLDLLYVVFRLSRGYHPSYFLTNIWGALALTLFFWLIWFISGGKWLGFGDVKLAFAIGLIFGLVQAAFVIYLAVIGGAVVGLALLLSRRANLKTKLPLGTFIAASAIFVIIFNDLLNYLCHLFSRLLFL